MPDVLADGLRVLFCGINPGLMTAASGHHFARPGNRFWPVLHLSGFTPRLLKPSEQGELPSYGLGITNVVARATARADELTADEYLEGGRLLTAKVERLRPRWLAVVGVTAYRAAFGDRKATVGPQERTIGDSRVGAAQPERSERSLDGGDDGGGVRPAAGGGGGLTGRPAA